MISALPIGIVKVVEETAQHTHLVFTIESLEYLHRGGRIGNASRLLGSALNIKPMLELKDGIVSPGDKVRTRKRAVEHLLKMAVAPAAGRPVVRLAVIHGGVEDEAQVLLEKAIETFQPPQETYLSFVTAVLGVHVGPGAIGIIVEWST